MRITDSVRELMTAIEANDSNALEEKLDNNFFFGGWTPETLDKDQFLDLIRGLKAGIPDLKFNTQNLMQIEGTDTVQGSIHISGTHTDTLDLSRLRVIRVPLVPPTGRSISLPTEKVVYLVGTNIIAGNNVISRMTVTLTPGGGLQGLLQQLGVQTSMLP